MHRVVEAFGDKVFHTVISRTVKFPETTVAGEPITTYAPASAGAATPTAQLAREVIAAVTAASHAQATGRACRASDAVRRATRRGFTGSRLDNFDGPFDLLLQLIGKHKLDVTEVALHRSPTTSSPTSPRSATTLDLDQTTEFLVVAATLLDLKAARLLPGRGESRTRRTSRCSRPATCCSPGCCSTAPSSRSRSLFAELEAAALRRFPALGRAGGAVRRAAARGAARRRPGAVRRRSPPRCCRPKPPPTVGIDHLHAPQVSVAEQAAILRERLAALGEATFRALTADCAGPLEVVARFLALLELFREADDRRSTSRSALGELTVRWTPPDLDRRRTENTAGDDDDEPAVEDGLPTCPTTPLEAALEALLLVVDAPTEDDAARRRARPARRPRPRGAAAAGRSATPPTAAGSTCAAWGRAGGSTPATPTPRSSSGCCSTASARS